MTTPLVIELGEPSPPAEIPTAPLVVEIPLGPPGPEGPAGPPGSGGAGASYVHRQSPSSNTWTIPHNLGFYPGGRVFTTDDGTEVHGLVTNLSVNVLQVSFGGPPVSGWGYLS